MIVFPVIRAAHWVLTAWMPELFQAASQSYQQVKLSLYAATHAIGGLPLVQPFEAGPRKSFGVGLENPG